MHPYDLHIEKKPKHLLASVKGSFDDPSTAFDYWSSIVKETLEASVEVVFVEEDFPNEPEIFEMYQSVRELATYFQGMTVIFIDHQKDHYEKNKFMETVAVNMGVDCYVYDDLVKARQKLKEVLSDITTEG